MSSEEMMYNIASSISSIVGMWALTDTGPEIVQKQFKSRIWKAVAASLFVIGVGHFSEEMRSVAVIVGVAYYFYLSKSSKDLYAGKASAPM
jgi:hypothetical protein